MSKGNMKNHVWCGIDHDILTDCDVQGGGFGHGQGATDQQLGRL